MLKDKLYKINTIRILPHEGDDNSAQKYSASVELDASHEIFRGHFPGNPILPGVCQVEMIREIAEEITGRKLLLSKAGQVKYLSLINPALNPALNVNIRLTSQNHDELDVSAEVASSDHTFMKMKGRFNSIKA
jgi:3-hydroxyacyl-[acyl-carrier-protein] dehydratase